MKSLALLVTLIALPVAAEDARHLVPLQPAAQEPLRQEMLDNLLALSTKFSPSSPATR